MADTIITTPASVPSSDNSAAGWVVAIVVILAVLFAGFFVLRGMVPASTAAPANPGANINVTLPSGSNTGGTGATGGTTGGATQY